MANRLSLHLLLVALTISTLLRPISTSSTLHSPPTTTTTTPPHSFSSSPPKTTTAGTTSSSAIQPPPQQPKVPSSPSDLPLPQQQQQQLLENIVSALLDTGNFRHWANLLSAAAAKPSTTTQQLLSTEATLLVPSDEALSHFPSTPTGASSPMMMMISFDPFLVPYHIIPQRLLFSQLKLFKPLTRLPTLLPSNSILITLNSHSNFSLDASPITHPDLYVNSAVAIHGIKNVLDYSLYGTAANRPSLPPPPPLITKGPQTETLGRKSGAAGFRSDDFTLVFVVVSAAAFALKI